MGAGEDSGSKEFDASESKLRNLRNKGSVPKSPEVNQLLTFIVAFSMIIGGSGYIWGKLTKMFQKLYGVIHIGLASEIGLGYIVKYSFEIFAAIIFPLLFCVSFAAILGDLLQVGILITPGSLSPKFDKLNPASYFKQTFSLKKVIEFVKQLAKVIILSVVAYIVVKKHLLEILTLVTTNSVMVVAHILKEIIVDFTIHTIIAMLIVTALDFGFQRFNFQRENRMTRKEMMDEFKQNEGDPMMKQQRRAMAKKFTEGQQAQLVKEADFLVVNPTQIAVALKYDNQTMVAPKVLAKGDNAFAWQLIKIAKQYDIPIIQNIPVARALHKLSTLDHEIPAELYRTIAEILLTIYNKKTNKEMSGSY